MIFPHPKPAWPAPASQEGGREPLAPKGSRLSRLPPCCDTQEMLQSLALPLRPLRFARMRASNCSGSWYRNHCQTRAPGKKYRDSFIGSSRSDPLPHLGSGRTVPWGQPVTGTGGICLLLPCGAQPLSQHPPTARVAQLLPCAVSGLAVVLQRV